VTSICTGAFVLAEAGLLNGRRATTHWYYARELQARFPEVKVEEDRIFIVDGPIWTSAGATAGLDLALALSKKTWVRKPSISGKEAVMHHRRAAVSPAFGITGLVAEVRPYSKRAILCEKNLGSSLSVDKLAEVASLSPRQFQSGLSSGEGQSPAKAVEKLRLEAARLMIEQAITDYCRRPGNRLWWIAAECARHFTKISSASASYPAQRPCRGCRLRHRSFFSSTW